MMASHQCRLKKRLSFIRTSVRVWWYSYADDRVDYDVDDVIEGVNEVAPVLNLPKILEKPETTIGNLSEGFSQFITGYIMLGGGGRF